MIVQSVMSEDPVTRPSDASVRTAAETMRDRGVGSVLVTEDDALVGILTERDLATRVLAEGLDPDGLAISDVMSSPVHTIEPAANIEDAIEAMIEHEVKRLAVVLEDEIRGVVSVRDIAHAEPELARRVTSYMRTQWEG